MSKTFQPWRKFQPDSDGTPHGWIQWKGTSVCMDFRCQCGALGHVDGCFGYYVKCAACGQLYELSGHVEVNQIEKLPEDSHPSCVLVADVDE